MNDFEIIERAGISTVGYSDAVKKALKNIEKQVHWFEVIDQRGRMTKDNNIEFQVVIKIGCS
ncbi:MAG: dodecin family protein [Candidatus Thermoplasmatota archaeon]|nr:dodecin family protein [Candidatus Thermoplasmatota archaeon]